MKCLDHIDMAVMAGAVATMASAAFLFGYLGIDREPPVPSEPITSTTFLQKDMEKTINDAVTTLAQVSEDRERSQVALGQAILNLVQVKAGQATFIPELAGKAAADAQARREFLEGVFKLPADWEGAEFAARERDATAMAQETLGRTIVTGGQVFEKEVGTAEARYGQVVLKATLADRRAAIEPAASHATIVAAARVMTELAKQTAAGAEPVIAREPSWGFGSIGEGVIIPFMVLGAGLGWLAATGAGMMERGARTRTTAAHCDVHEKDILVEMLVSDETPYEVVRCSAFNGGPVTCDKHCLNWPMARAA